MLEPLDNKDRFGKRAAIATLAVLAVLLGCSDDLPAPATDQRVNRDSSVDRTPAADTTITDSAPTDTGTDVGKSDAAGADATPASDATSVPLAPIIPTTSDPCPTFATGEQTIKELVTHMLVGKTGATRGPLLFNWHGTGGDGKRALDAIPASIRADIEARGGIIIAPTDNRKKRVGPSPNGVWFEESDLDYADHLVACAVKNHNIDPRQIYVTGCSAGGLMAAAMATKRSSYVAAAYPNSGGLVWGGKWQDKTRIPAVLTMHGGAGDTVVVNFQKTSERFLNLVKEAGGFGADCNHNIGHCKAPTQLEEFAWSFVNAHPFGTRPFPYAVSLPAAAPSYCKIW